MLDAERVAMPTFDCGTGNDVYFRRLSEALRRAGLTVDLLSWPRWREFLSAFPDRSRRALDGYGLVHTNADWGVCFVAPGRPLVVTLHHCVLDPHYRVYISLPQRLYHDGLLRRRLGRSLERAAVVLCPSRSTRDAAARLFPDFERKLRLAPHGIDLERFRPQPEIERRPKRLLAVGSISRRKGAELFPALMDALGPDYRLQYVGRGDATLLRHPRIEPLGRVQPDALLHLYRSCAVHVSFSRLEGFGYSVAEAMACGAPVVATDCSSHPELLGDTEDQLFPIDDVCGAAARIRSICGDDTLRDRLGRANRGRAEERFRMDRMIEATVSAYREARETT